MSIIELEDHRLAWTYGKAICLQCRYEYVNTVHKDADKRKLECPKCHAMDSFCVTAMDFVPAGEGE